MFKSNNTITFNNLSPRRKLIYLIEECDNPFSIVIGNRKYSRSCIKAVFNKDNIIDKIKDHLLKWCLDYDSSNVDYTNCMIKQCIVYL